MTIKTTERVVTVPINIPDRPTGQYHGLCYFPKQESWNPSRPVKVKLLIHLLTIKHYEKRLTFANYRLSPWALVLLE
jgi:hypothetical protein